ncbi:MAG: NGG1p interacting factor NIF3 [Deltaproteobacteria bacterium]|nr:NGG1p interacting factor NIF3 [Deltaproteobacteria bacterium]
MYKLVLFVPASHKESVKDALFEAGLGKYKNYDSCCFETKGEGQFRPLLGSNPFKGDAGILEKAEEYKIEMLCDDSLVKTAIEVIKLIHPYEEPAFELYPVRIS